jgi:acetyl esterase/lipase
MLFAQSPQYVPAGQLSKYAATSGKILLWPGRAAPGALGSASADTPYITVYLPPANIPVVGTMLFCPGGAYSQIVTSEQQMARNYFLPKGWIVAVLQYRVAPYKHPVPLWDVKRAMRLVRGLTKTWNADPYKICCMGCSAGGHLASTLATHYDTGNPAAPDSIDRISCKPDICVFVFPVITMDASFTHMGSRINLLGNNPPQALVDSLSNEKQVSANTPPCFLAHGTVDNLVPWKNSQVFYDSCVSHNVKTKFQKITDTCGYHGFLSAIGAFHPVCI